MTQSLPELVAFDLDGTLWKLKHGDLVLRRDMAKIMRYLYRNKVKLAICSKHDSKQEAIDFFKDNTVRIHGVDKTLRSLIAHGCFIIQSTDKRDHFVRVHEATGIAYSDMVFFDDDIANKVVERKGVNFYQVGSAGLDWRTFDAGLAKYDYCASSSSEDDEDT
ncbi:acid phosphatase-domain-containing protein [Mycena capillaripes]|nr:acid phosphatase-domain-containing protein [Mycena capillaripes]